MTQQHERRRVGPVAVLDHEQQRLAARLSRRERRRPRCAAGDARCRGRRPSAPAVRPRGPAGRARSAQLAARSAEVLAQHVRVGCAGRAGPAPQRRDGRRFAPPRRTPRRARARLPRRPRARAPAPGGSCPIPPRLRPAPGGHAPRARAERDARSVTSSADRPTNGGGRAQKKRAGKLMDVRSEVD